MVATHYGTDKEPSDFMREHFHQSEKTCAYCGVNLTISNEGKGPLLCLNGCYLTHGAKMRMDQGLHEAVARVQEREQEQPS
jgi:hypothetical protein